jgi:hypothetical protein
MNTIKEYLKAAKAAPKAESAPPPVPPRPNPQIHAMLGPIASVALAMMQEMMLTLIRKAALTVDEADDILARVNKLPAASSLAAI